MIVVMAPQATAAEIEVVQARIAEEGYAAHLSQGEARTVIGVIGAGDDRKQTFADQVESLAGVERVIFLAVQARVQAESRSDRSVVEVGERGQRLQLVVRWPAGGKLRSRPRERARQWRRQAPRCCAAAPLPRTSPST